MKKPRLLAIRPQSVPATQAQDVDVLLEVDETPSPHQVHVEPERIAGRAALLLTPSAELARLLRDDQPALHRLLRLVSDALHGAAIPVPQPLAA